MSEIGDVKMVIITSIGDQWPDEHHRNFYHEIAACLRFGDGTTACVKKPAYGFHVNEVLTIKRVSIGKDSRVPYTSWWWEVVEDE